MGGTLGKRERTIKTTPPMQLVDRTIEDLITQEAKFMKQCGIDEEYYHYLVTNNTYMMKFGTAYKRKKGQLAASSTSAKDGWLKLEPIARGAKMVKLVALKKFIQRIGNTLRRSFPWFP